MTGCGKQALGQRDCIFRIGNSCSLSPSFKPPVTHVSHFVSMLLLAIALILTLCFGVAAWRLSADKEADITATIPHPEYGWRSRSNN